MQARVIPFTITLLFVAGCGLFKPFDPCAENSPLQQDPEVAADCQACSMSPCPEDSETGEEDLDGAQELTCFAGTRAKALSVGRSCFVGHWEAADFDDVAQSDLEYRIVDDCLTESDPYPCRRSWNVPGSPPASGPSQCMLCTAWEGSPNPKAIFALGAPDYDFADDFDEMLLENKAFPRVCQTPDHVTSRFSRAAYHGPGNSSILAFENWYTNSWWKYQSCVAGEPTPNSDIDWLVPIDTCEDMVQMKSENGYEHDPQDNVTCRCFNGNDDLCPVGMMCEWDWQFTDIGGIYPHPTLCGWALGQGNGPASDGPIVYGLDAWEQGLAIENRSRNEVGVRLTSSILVTLTTTAAAWNDDQRFNVTTGELTYCGPDALCDLLGLVTGDRLHLPRTSGLELLTGREMAFVVEHENGETTTFVVSIEFDGDLTDY